MSIGHCKYFVLFYENKRNYNWNKSGIFESETTILHLKKDEK